MREMPVWRAWSSPSRQPTGDPWLWAVTSSFRGGGNETPEWAQKAHWENQDQWGLDHVGREVGGPCLLSGSSARGLEVSQSARTCSAGPRFTLLSVEPALCRTKEHRNRCEALRMGNQWRLLLLPFPGRPGAEMEARPPWGGAMGREGKPGWALWTLGETGSPDTSLTQLYTGLTQLCACHSGSAWPRTQASHTPSRVGTPRTPEIPGHLPLWWRAGPCCICFLGRPLWHKV